MMLSSPSFPSSLVGLDPVGLLLSAASTSGVPVPSWLVAVASSFDGTSALWTSRVSCDSLLLGWGLGPLGEETDTDAGCVVSPRLRLVSVLVDEVLTMLLRSEYSSSELADRRFGRRSTNVPERRLVDVVGE